MKLDRSRMRAAALLAMAAIALQSLWPLLAHARPAPRSVSVELCSADGVIHRATVPADDGPVAAGHALCGLCLTGCERGAATPGIAPATVVAAPGRLQTPAMGATVFASRSFPPARSRAPPAAS